MSDNNLSPVKRALLEIKDLQTKLHEAQTAQKEPIAIIGAGLRFPGGVNDLDSYWQLLAHGVDAVTDIPKNRWDIEMFYDPDPETPGKPPTNSMAV
jgi:acyl transferase domain-containing protein